MVVFILRERPTHVLALLRRCCGSIFLCCFVKFSRDSRLSSQLYSQNVRIQAGSGIFTAIIIAIAFAFIPASYAVFLVKEREAKVRRSHVTLRVLDHSILDLLPRCEEWTSVEQQNLFAMCISNMRSHVERFNTVTACIYMWYDALLFHRPSICS